METLTRFYTLAEAAKAANVTYSTIAEAIRSARIPFDIRGSDADGYDVLIDQAALDEYIARRANWSKVPAERTAVRSHAEIRSVSRYICLAEVCRRHHIKLRTVYEHADRGYLRCITILFDDAVPTWHRLTTEEWVEPYLALHHQPWPQGYHTVREAAALLKLSKQRVYQLLELGDLDYIWVNARCAIDGMSIEHYIQRKFSLTWSSTGEAG